MKYGVDIPNFGYWADPRNVATFARQVENAGWDGLSIWDHLLVWEGNEVGDPWIALAAAATATQDLILMNLVAPLPRRRPWKVAREAVSLDQLSQGRFVLGVGIGFPPEQEFGTFGENTDARHRADLLDESLDIITGLWTGAEFSYQGKHYSVDPVSFKPTPVQQPRIPIWVAGMWPNKRPFRRAGRYDGVAPIVYRNGRFEPMTGPILREVLGYVDAHRTEDGPFDVTVYRPLPSDRGEAVDVLAELEGAGATWFRDGWDPESPISPAEWQRRVLEGPPR